ncbi:MAG: hypothetical protein JWP92_201 [Caulobacter sp.]|nr:hypothetical protein [Caulobacter sp.]
MTVPDQTHPIRIARHPGRVRVLFEGHEIADSDDVVTLYEHDYPPVRYFPRDDVRMAFLHRTNKVSHCPYKGDAAYFTIGRDGVIVENAVWSYEDPFPAVGEIGARVAFYPEHVEFQLDGLTPAETARRDIDEAVRHTDSGAGTSQAEPWAPTVDRPGDTAAADAPSRPYEGTGSI